MRKLKDDLLHINARDLFNKIGIETLLILDIREPFELDEASIPKAVNIPMNVLSNNMKSILNKDTVYYILCHTGQRSYYVTRVLTDAGYKVINIVGGIDLMPEFYYQ